MRVLLVVAVIMTVSAAPAGARVQMGAEVRLISPLQVTSEPQRVHVFSFLVINRSGREFRFREEASLPAGWSLLIPASSFVLGPGQETSRLLSVQIPIGAAEGLHKIVYSVAADRDPAIRGSDEISVTVLAVERSDLMAESQPDSLIAGEEFTLGLRLMNSGNSSKVFYLKARATDEGSTAVAAPAEITLGPGENAPVSVVGRVNPQFIGTVLAVRIIAESEKGGKREEAASVTLLLEVVSSISRKPEPYHILPTTLSVSATRTAGGGTSPFFQWEGSGFLDEEGERALSFSFSGPSLDDSYIFSRMDEYWLSYSSPVLGIRLGDQPYGTSPLTVSSSYGRGAGLDFKSVAGGKWAFGGFQVKNRFGSSDWTDEGVYVQHNLGEDSYLRFNMTRSDSDPTSSEPASSDSLWSIEARLRPDQNSSLEMEYARCDTDRPSGGENDAYRFLWQGMTASRISYAFRKIHAGEDFWGYYHSYDYESGALSFPLGSRLRAGIAASKYRNNIGLRSSESDTAVQEALVQATLEWNMRNGWFFVLGFDDFSREDRLLPAKFDYSEQSFWVRLGRSYGQFSWSVEPRFSDQKDYLTGESVTAWNAAILVSYAPNPNLALSVYYNFGDNDVLQDSYLLRGSSSFGGALFWRISPQWTLNVAYSRSGIGASGRTESDQLDIIAACSLTEGQVITLEVSKSDDETEYRLTYSIPVGIKTVKKKNVGILRGRVYDGTAPGGAGLQNIVVRVGPEAVATGADGSFIFPALSPGPHRIYIDPKSIGYGYTTDKKYPITLEIIGGGDPVEMDIGIVKGAVFRGRVIMAGADGAEKGEGFVLAPGAGGEERKGPAARVLVELSREDEVARRSTDERGEFVFENLRPGVWNLKFYYSGLTPGYMFETETGTIELAPGDEKEFVNRIIPKKRLIRFIDSGKISQAPAGGRK